MSNLSNLIKTRSEIIKGNAGINVETISVFEQGANCVSSLSSLCCRDYCTSVTGCQNITIEIWGSAGRSESSCCCGISLPGNPGAYVRKDLTGFCGWICTNAPLSDKSASFTTGTTRCEAAQVIVCDITNACCYCLCAETGFNGRSFCFTGTSPYACMKASGYCGTDCVNTDCGIICNISGVELPAQGYGGDINCNGGFSCIVFNNIDPTSIENCVVVESSPNIINAKGTKIIGRASSSGCKSGMFAEGLYESVSSYGQMLNRGQVACYCWTGEQWCSCYNSRGCEFMMPPGIPGASSSVCGGSQDFGQSGGPGKIIIRFKD